MSIIDAIFYEFSRADSYKTFVAKRSPHIFISNGFQTFSDFIKSTTFEHIIDLLIILNAIVCAIQSWDILMGVSESNQNDDNALTLLEDGRIDTIWEVLVCMLYIQVI